MEDLNPSWNSYIKLIIKVEPIKCQRENIVQFRLYKIWVIYEDVVRLPSSTDFLINIQISSVKEDKIVVIVHDARADENWATTDSVTPYLGIKGYHPDSRFSYLEYQKNMNKCCIEFQN